MAAALVGRQQQLPHHDVRMPRHLLLELGQQRWICLSRGELIDRWQPLEGIVAESAANLDGMLTKVRESETGKPPPVIAAVRQRLQHVVLGLPVPSEFVTRDRTRVLTTGTSTH